MFLSGLVNRIMSHLS